MAIDDDSGFELRVVGQEPAEGRRELRVLGAHGEAARVGQAGVVPVRLELDGRALLRRELRDRRTRGAGQLGFGVAAVDSAWGRQGLGSAVGEGLDARQAGQGLSEGWEEVGVPTAHDEVARRAGRP